jgi:hypothetical protein
MSASSHLKTCSRFSVRTRDVITVLPDAERASLICEAIHPLPGLFQVSQGHAFRIVVQYGPNITKTWGRVRTAMVSTDLIWF